MATSLLAQRVVTEVAALLDQPRESLAALWGQRFGCVPPRGCGRQLLELAASYAIQEKMCGRLNAATRRALGSAWDSDGVAPDQPRRRRKLGPADSRRSIKPGTRLVREWNGRSHHVEVVEDGFVWNGKMHRSLSVIAREITGAQWSGPRFFGL